MDSDIASKTPEVRRCLQTIRRQWAEANEHNPFRFTNMLDEKQSLEMFCTQFILLKYNVPTKNIKS